MDKVLKNQHGVSLVNALISVGLFGVLALAGATVVKQQIHTAETVALQPNLAYLIDEIRAELSLPHICAQNFQTKNARSENLQIFVSKERKILGVDELLNQGNGLIVTSLSLSDSAHEVSVAAGSTHFVIELYHQATGSKHSRQIKIHVSVDEQSRILQCYSTGPVSESSVGAQTSFWSNVTGTANLTYLNGPLVLTQDVQAREVELESLGVYTNELLLFGDDESKCLPLIAGALRFKKSSSSLEFCSKQMNRWLSLRQSGLHGWEQQDFTLTTDGADQKSHGLRNWELCYLRESNESSGSCAIRPLGNKNWLLEIKQETQSTINCALRCFRSTEIL